MQTIFDIDAVLLLATSLAAKRRAAELVEVMAAIDLIHHNIPAEEKLDEALSRLGRLALLTEDAGCLDLSPAAQAIIAALPHKGEMAVRLAELKRRLAEYENKSGETPIAFGADRLRAAIMAHRAAGAGARKNLLVPKPALSKGEQQRPGQRRRKPLPPSSRRKH